MTIIIKGNNNGFAVENGNVNIDELNFEFGKGIKSAKGMKVEDIEDAVIVEEGRAEGAAGEQIEEDLPSFEEAIPEYLRTGKLLVAWNKLRKAGILNEDYRLADDVSNAAAHFMVTCFCEKKKNNEWKPFEQFWGLKDLRWSKCEFSKEQELKISTIFREL